MIKKIIQRVFDKLILEKSPYTKQQSECSVFYEKDIPRGRGVFIDCGGYDGCSALKFISINPHFDCITFEPNPELWEYYHLVPSTLIKKGIAGESCKLQLTVDHIDGDGSSVIPGKKILYGSDNDDSTCRKIEIDCVSVVKLIKEISKIYDSIILKLDVEGMEYSILELLHEEKILGKISRIYAEFHWKKCGFKKSRHNKLAKILRAEALVYPWDGVDFAIHMRGEHFSKARREFVEKTFPELERYQTIRLSFL